jgi:DNA-binding CsgD family transcriptional regulator
VGDGDDASLGDFVPDDETGEPADQAAQEMLKQRIEAVLKTLTYREREIIKLRYGIGDGYTYTLEEVGRIFKVTRERVRQVEAKAIRKLQHPVRARKLQGFVDGSAYKDLRSGAEPSLGGPIGSPNRGKSLANLASDRATIHADAFEDGDTGEDEFADVMGVEAAPASQDEGWSTASDVAAASAEVEDASAEPRLGEDMNER